MFLDFDAYGVSLMPLIESARPRLALASSRTAAALPINLLRVALSEDLSGLSPDDRRRAGLALLTGVGAPRDIARTQSPRCRGEC